MMCNDKELSTPVLLMTFNRLETTKKVLGEIRKVKPKKLYISSDGPRADKLNENAKIEAVRSYVLSQIDWSCELEILFNDKNLGCGIAVSKAISWFFDYEEEGIILEDDCLPDSSFFWFCQDMLQQYRNDERIMSISASNIFDDKIEIEYSYFFSKFSLMWGWATWRRAWKHYDREMYDWPRLKQSNWLATVRGNDLAFKARWTRIFDQVYPGANDIWDYQWIYTCWLHRGLTILPSKNLVKNIGYGDDATHTKKSGSILSNLERKKITFPLSHPKMIEIFDDAEVYIAKYWFYVRKVEILRDFLLRYSVTRQINNLRKKIFYNLK